MALNRVVWGTLAACLLITAALVPPRGGRLRGSVMPRGRPELPRASQARMALRQAQRDLRIARIRDSLLLEVRPGAPITVIVDPRVPEHAAQAARDRINNRWEGAVGATGARLVVALLSDSTLTLTDYSAYLLPETSADPCIALGALTQWEIERGIRRQLGRFLRAMVSELPGPCGFFATFGMPGEAIRDWLESNKFIWASRLNWNTTTWERQRVDWNVRGFRQMALLPLRACAGGALDICTALARTSEDTTLGEALYMLVSIERTPGPPTGLNNAVYFAGYGFSDLGPHARYLLSDLVVEFGTDRFAAFWTSEQPVPEAFTEAFGISLPEWLQKWAVNQFGPIRNGPGVPAPSYVFGIFLSVVFVGGSMVVVRRRQVK